MRNARETDAGTARDTGSRLRPQDLKPALERWIASTIISADQARSIREFETVRSEPARRRVPLITEALGYLGAALALAGGLAALGRVWGELGSGARVGWILGGLLVTLVGGAVARRSDEPALTRLGSVLWFVSAGIGFLLSGTLVVEHTGWEEDTAVLAIAVGGTAYALVLYLVSDRTLQHLALFAGLVVAAASGAGLLPYEPSTESPWRAVAVLLLALVWLGLAWYRRIRPERVGFAVGAAAGLLATTFAGERFATAALVVGLPLALTVAGGLLLAIALVTTRLKRFTAPPAGGVA